MLAGYTTALELSGNELQAKLIEYIAIAALYVRAEPTA